MSTRIPDGITRQHVLDAIRSLKEGAGSRFGPSTSYDLVFEGRGYPPKEVLGLAATRLTGEEYGPYDFTGGKNTKCFRVLQELGFKIEEKG